MFYRGFIEPVLTFGFQGGVCVRDKNVLNRVVNVLEEF